MDTSNAKNVDYKAIKAAHFHANELQKLLQFINIKDLNVNTELKNLITMLTVMQDSKESKILEKVRETIADLKKENPPEGKLLRTKLLCQGNTII